MLGIGQTYQLNQSVSTGIAPGGSQYSAPQGSQLKIKNTRNEGGRLFYDIDQTPFGGGTGWVEASALEAAIQAANNNQPAPSSQPSNNGGGSSAAAAFSTPKPTINLQSVYDSAFKDSNITGLQGEADSVQKEIDARMQALAAAEADINDNPYYAEATRTGQIAKLRASAQNDINNLNGRVSNAQNKVAQAKADAQVKVNLATQQYQIDSQEYQQQLQLFNTLLSSGALNSASGSDIASISTATGLSTSMVSSIIDSAKAKENKPQLITVDDGVNQKIVAVDATGKIINETILGASKAGASGGGGGSSGVGGGGYTSGQYNQAVQVIKEVDVMNQGNNAKKADKKLAAWEIQAAVQRLSSYLGGDIEKAKSLVVTAMNSEGYSEWTG